MVRIGSFCMDSTEVTQKQYAAFTLDKAGDTSGQQSVCEWNTSFGAGCGFNPKEKPNHPVQGVDWCDAFAFCEWAGKRLCGGPQGAGTQGSSSLLETARNQWYTVCTGGGSKEYPYGGPYDPTACNQLPATDAVEVGSLKSCEGGYDGVFDMTGNMLEWVNFCDEGGPSPDKDTCYLMGGGYDQGQDAQRCAYRQPYSRDRVWCTFGFRCCADPR